MEGYSKIKEIELFNFMSFKHATLVFDESNILNIKGYNDSGKSAILRAVAVCLDDMFKRAQNKYIRYGCDYFRIAVTFDDGVAIVRDKYLNGQSLYEMYKDGKLVFTTKQGNRLTRIEGVPQVIEDYLGLCNTENGCINYQSCNDKLLLVDTSGSENYQELNSVLKSEEISRATYLINSDRNEMNSKMIEMENEFQEANAVLKSRSYVDEWFIDYLEDLDKKCDVLQGRDDSISKMNEDCVKLSSIPEMPNLSVLNTVQIIDISKLNDSSLELMNLISLPDVNKIDLSRNNKLSEISEFYEKLFSLTSREIPEISLVDVKKESAVSGLKELKDKICEYSEIPEISSLNTRKQESISCLLEDSKKLQGMESLWLPEISKVGKTEIDMLKDLDSVKSELSEYLKSVKSIRNIERELKKLRDDVSTLVSEDESNSFVICPNCGTFVAVS